MRPEVSALSRFQAGDGFRLAALGRDAPQPRGRAKHDGPFAIPCAPGEARRVADVLRRPARSLDLAQFPGHHESDEAAVAGPEWQIRIFGSRQPPRRYRTDGTKKQRWRIRESRRPSPTTGSHKSHGVPV